MINRYQLETTLKIEGNKPARLKLGRVFAGHYAIMPRQVEDNIDLLDPTRPAVVGEVRAGKRLKIRGNTDRNYMWYCRDQYVPAMVGMLRAFSATYPNLTLSSRSNSPVRILNQYDSPRTALLNEFADRVGGFLFTGPNEGMNWLSSPFLFRYLISVERWQNTATLKKWVNYKRDSYLIDILRFNRSLGWFFQVMLDANENGVSLVDDMHVAWSAKRWIPHSASGYGHMGFSSFRAGMPSSVVNGIKKAFPPARNSWSALCDGYAAAQGRV